MTRFVIKSKAHGDQTITVDAADAYILRSQAWHVRKTRSGHIYFCRKGVAGDQVFLHRYLANAQNSDGVRFANSDTLDMRRSNLIKEDLATTKAAIALIARRSRSLYKIASAKP